MTRSEKISAKMKTVWADPAQRAERSAKIKEKWANADYREKQLSKKQDAAYVEQISASVKSLWAQDEYRKELTEKAKKRTASAEQQEKMILLRAQTGKKIACYPKDREDHPFAIHVTLRSPDNVTYKISNLAKFVRENAHLFSAHDLVIAAGCKFPRAYINLTSITRKKNPIGCSMGWTLVSKTEVFYNSGEDLIERQKHEVHSI